MALNEKYGSNLAFIDLLFNVLVGFVFLFVVAFILINPIAKRADVVTPAEFLITMSWPDEDQNDVDLWVRDPVQNYIGFRSKDVGVTNLDRDDLGALNDRVSIAPGKDVTVNVNREVTSIRGILPGEYVVSIHLYNGTRLTDAGVPVTVEIQKINPYSPSNFKSYEELQAKLNRVLGIDGGNTTTPMVVYQHCIGIYIHYDQ